MRKLGIISILIGIICYITKALTTTMDSNGFIHEYLILIPLGLLFLIVGLILIIISLKHTKNKNF